MNLSPRFEQGLHYAVLIHSGQKRKGTNIPYLAHLLGVTRIALEHGAYEDEAIGGCRNFGRSNQRSRHSPLFMRSFLGYGL
jgi:hypothetical protein